MRKRDLGKFKKLLGEEKKRILQNALRTADGDATIDAEDLPDIVDLATSDLNLNLNVDLRERERHLMSKIDEALARIEDGSFGVCEECGEAIGIARLQVRPVTTLCIKCKEEQEELERRGGSRQEEEFRFPIKPLTSSD
ncbi:MAG: TraR/DksA family transcriptional regulator [Myxococcota bacterium]